MMDTTPHYESEDLSDLNHIWCGSSVDKSEGVGGEKIPARGVFDHPPHKLSYILNAPLFHTSHKLSHFLNTPSFLISHHPFVSLVQAPLSPSQSS